jgi:hypothetical protein
MLTFLLRARRLLPVVHIVSVEILLQLDELHTERVAQDNLGSL